MVPSKDVNAPVSISKAMLFVISKESTLIENPLPSFVEAIVNVPPPLPPSTVNSSPITYPDPAFATDSPVSSPMLA
jgi:hypothetical protein